LFEERNSCALNENVETLFKLSKKLAAAVLP